MAEDASPSSIPTEYPDASLPNAEPPPAVHLQATAVTKLNLADFQNAVPALRELTVVNGTAAALTDLTLASHRQFCDFNDTNREIAWAHYELQFAERE